MSRRTVAAAAVVLLTAVGCKHPNHASNSPSGPPAITSPADGSGAPTASDANGDSGILP